MADKQQKRRLHEEYLRQQHKARRRSEKAAYRAERELQKQKVTEHLERIETVDCACVIHGSAYSWDYVEKLYNMLERNLVKTIRFHVYTEHDRSVPPHMIKHNLMEWPGVSGPKASWWYKMQLFNTAHHKGPLLYLDLDTVIVRNLDWITELPLGYLWAIKDFRYLWRSHNKSINSSVMWWDTRDLQWVWENFANQDIAYMRKKYHGDQDFLTETIPDRQRRTFDEKYILSYRWQAKDGGFDFQRRQHKIPNSGVRLGNETSLLIFHGSPKPHEVNDKYIMQFWQ
jgi:hypothetical protein